MSADTASIKLLSDPYLIWGDHWIKLIHISTCCIFANKICIRAEFDKSVVCSPLVQLSYKNTRTGKTATNFALFLVLDRQIRDILTHHIYQLPGRRRAFSVPITMHLLRNPMSLYFVLASQNLIFKFIFRWNLSVATRRLEWIEVDVLSAHLLRINHPLLLNSQIPLQAQQHDTNIPIRSVLHILPHHVFTPYLLWIFQRSSVVDRVADYHDIWVHMGIWLSGVGFEIIEIESICAIMNADSEGKELVVFGVAVDGFLGSLGEASIPIGALLSMEKTWKPMGFNENAGEKVIREKARFATQWIAEKEDRFGRWFVHLDVTLTLGTV